MTTPAKSDKDRVVIFDTTLRDGEQCPGATMTHEEKLEVAELLDTMGVDVIEAGFPIASEGDWAAVHEIAKRTKNAVVCGLSRAAPKDIDRCAEAIKPAKRKRIHTFLSTSPVHMKWKLQKEPHEVLQMVIDQVTRARSHTDDVEWSAEDATRTEHDFLCRCVEAAINAGATTINIPDTVGYTVPEEYFALFKMLRERVPNSDKARVLGALPRRPRHGGGEFARRRSRRRAADRMHHQRHRRAGRQRLARRGRDGDAGAQRRACRIWTNIDATMLTRASKLVAAVTSFPVQYNKAIVGRNAFAHESGIHQDGMLKHTQTYEIMTPETVGVKQTSLVMGKHSGRHAFVHKLEELGYKLAGNQLEDAFVRFKALADKKKQVYDEDIEALGRRGDRARARSHQGHLAHGDRRHHGTAVGDADARHRRQARHTQSTGNGPVDAIFNAIHALVPHEAKLELYQVHAVTEGTDAQAEVSVRLAGERACGHRQGRRSRHAGGVGEGVSRRAEQADEPPSPRTGGRASYPFDRRRLILHIARERKCRALAECGNFLQRHDHRQHNSATCMTVARWRRA